MLMIGSGLRANLAYLSWTNMVHICIGAFSSTVSIATSIGSPPLSQLSQTKTTLHRHLRHPLWPLLPVLRSAQRPRHLALEQGSLL